MTPEKWKTVKKFFEAVVETPTSARMDRLEQLCAGDAELQAAVQELLDADKEAGNLFRGGDASTETYPAHECSPLSFLSEELIAGRFKILRFLDSGGMGEVYEAWDSELQEKVALKTIRSEIASLPGTIDGFKREVKQARGISHPNICRVYDLFQTERDQGRMWFLTMQLLDGKTILQRIHEQGPFAKTDAVEIIRQMIAGLSAAHQMSIVHGDFKSGNVMLTELGDGRIRAVITDFGMAFKLVNGRREDRFAQVQGTPDYMAPEQRSHGKIGFAADQYALGIVIYEMLTGDRPRYGKISASEYISSQKPDHLDARTKAAILRCVEPKPEDRFPDIADVFRALSDPERDSTVKRWLLGGALAATVAGMLVVGAYQPKPRVEAITQLTPATDLSSAPSLSRNGEVVAYESDRGEVGNVDIWVQHLPSGNPVRITHNPAEDLDPSIAPDGSAVAFRSERKGGGIYLSDATGRGERLLVPEGRNPRFSPTSAQIVYWVGDEDDTIASGKVYVLSLDGKAPVQIAANFFDARLPLWSSDGKFILFRGCKQAYRPVPACSEWWASSADGRQILPTNTMALLREAKILQIGPMGGWDGTWVLFSGRRATTTSLWALRLSEENLKAKGSPAQLTSGEAREITPSFSDNGTLAYAHLSGALHIWRITLGLNPSQAVGVRLTEDPQVDITPSVSDNGKWLAFSRGNGSSRDIWIKDMESGAESQFVGSTSEKISPLVNDSGQEVVFEELQSEVPAIYKARRGETPVKLCSDCGNPTSWFDGNDSLLYREGSPSKIALLDLKTKSRKIILSTSDASLGEPSWSPDNQFVLFTATKGAKKQIFGVLLPRGSGTPVGNWIPISEESGWSDKPRWSSDGRTAYYLSTRDGFTCLWGQNIDLNTGATVGVPFPVMHYHNLRFSPATVFERSLNLSVSGDSIYLNVGESSASIWTGILKPRKLSTLFSWQ